MDDKRKLKRMQWRDKIRTIAKTSNMKSGVRIEPLNMSKGSCLLTKLARGMAQLGHLQSEPIWLCQWG